MLRRILPRSGEDSPEYWAAKTVIACFVLLCWLMPWRFAVADVQGTAVQLAVDRQSGRVNWDLTDTIEYQFTGKTLDLAQIQTKDSGWQAMSEQGSSLGFNKQTLWLRTQIVSFETRDLYLLFDYPILDFIDLYLVTGNAVSHVQSGDRIALDDRPLKHRKLVIPIQLASQQATWLYIRVHGDSSYTVPVKLMDPATFHELEADQNVFLSALFGAGWVMILLNIFLGITLRQKSYFYYVLFTLSFTMFNFTLQGYSRFYLWQSAPVFNDMTVILWGQLGGISYACFLMSVLPLKKYYPRNYLCCKIHVLLMSIFAVFSLGGLHNALQVPTHFFNALFACYSMWLTFTVWRGGARAAKFIFIGWVFLMSAVVIKALLAAGLIPYNQVLFHSFDLGMTLNFVLLAFAMGYQMVDAKNNEEAARQEAERAKNMALGHMEQYRALFEYAPIPMFKINAQDHFVRANKAFVELFGYDNEKQLLDAGLQSKSLYQSKKDYATILSSLRRHHIADHEAILLDQNREPRWVRVSVRKLANTEQTLYEGACIDITAQKLQRQSELEQHQREVKQLEALVSGVAHYLNTPLGSATTAQSLISGKTEEVDAALSQQTLTANRLKSFITLVQSSASVIKSSLQKSVQVVNRFRELKPDETEPSYQQVSPDELLHSLRLSLPEKMRDSLAIDLKTKIKLLDLPLRQVLHVLQKLSCNAQLHGEADTVSIEINPHEQGYLLLFSDNGKGLSEEVNADDLFAPFFAKTLSLQEVSGLDLFVVKSIVQNRLNGKVLLNRAALPKLQFEIWLPTSANAEL